MEFLKVLEGIRTPWLSGFLAFYTHLGEELFLTVIGLLLYWCISKRGGLFIIETGLAGTAVNQWMKIVNRIPRPWVADETFTIVESARAEATGYSFPSGHSQNAVSIFGGLAFLVKKTWAVILCIVMGLLVLFSRMYLGVHYPSDVLVGGGVALIVLLIFQPLMVGKRATKATVRGAMIASIVVSAAFVVYMQVTTFPADVDADNLASAMKNSWTVLGTCIGIFAGYELEEAKVNFTEKAPLLTQIVKLVIGLGLTVAIRALLKSPLNALCGGHPVQHAIRYAIMTFFAAGIWPMTFPWITKITTRK